MFVLKLRELGIECNLLCRVAFRASSYPTREKRDVDVHVVFGPSQSLKGVTGAIPGCPCCV